MKNIIAEVKNYLSLGACVLILGCGGETKQSPPDTKQPEVVQEKNHHYNMPLKRRPDKNFSADTTMRTNTLFSNYLLQKKAKNKLLSRPDSLNELKKMSTPLYRFYPTDCGGSTSSLPIQIEYYSRFGFYYIYDFTQTYNFLAYAEIPRSILESLISSTGGEAGTDHCGLMMYFGWVDNSQVTLAYHEEPRLSPIPSDLFPKGSATGLSSPYYKAECAVTRTFSGDEAELDNDLWNYSRAPYTFTTPTIANDEIDNHGYSFMENIYYNYPIGFFHANELRELVTQNDATGGDNIYGRWESIRVYLGFDPRPGELFKVRLVIFAVDHNGKNILVTPDGYDAYILEHSWPPF